MHDPMVVAHEIHVPIPRRTKWREMGDNKRSRSCGPGCSTAARNAGARDDQATERDTLIRHLFAAVRVLRDETEPETLAWLTDSGIRALSFAEARRLWMLLGYERNDDYELVPTEPRSTP